MATLMEASADLQGKAPPAPLDYRMITFFFFLRFWGGGAEGKEEKLKQVPC